MRIRRPISDPKPHPLHNVVLKAFDGREVHDSTTLAVALAGATTLSGKGGPAGMRAYQRVAADVLGYMADQGVLIVDGEGWYRLANP